MLKTGESGWRVNRGSFPFNFLIFQNEKWVGGNLKKQCQLSLERVFTFFFFILFCILQIFLQGQKVFALHWIKMCLLVQVPPVRQQDNAPERVGHGASKTQVLARHFQPLALWLASSSAKSTQPMGLWWGSNGKTNRSKLSFEKVVLFKAITPIHPTIYFLNFCALQKC